MSEVKPSERAEAGCNQAAILRSRPDPSSVRRLNPRPSPGKAGASRRKPRPARPCAVARVVTNRTKRSDQAIALRGRSARMRRINGLRSVAEMVQTPLDDAQAKHSDQSDHHSGDSHIGELNAENKGVAGKQSGHSDHSGHVTESRPNGQTASYPTIAGGKVCLSCGGEGCGWCVR